MFCPISDFLCELCAIVIAFSDNILLDHVTNSLRISYEIFYALFRGIAIRERGSNIFPSDRSLSYIYCPLPRSMVRG